MVKVIAEGKNPPIASYPEAPQSSQLIEQLNGQRVSVETCHALAFGAVSPAGDGEAAELIRWLWDHAGAQAMDAGRWNGWQTVAWIATNNLAVVARLAGPIDFIDRHGGRSLLHARNVEACLGWEIAHRHCRCDAGQDSYCSCIDDGLGKLNAKLRVGELIELGQQSLGPINSENAQTLLFSSYKVKKLFPAPKPRGRPAGNGIDDAAAIEEMHGLIKRGEATSVYAAAIMVAPNAAGSKAGDSTARRLERKYGATKGLEK
ncbi:MAG: hypothetical protein P0Y64_08125 [Candidatus Sphingomonas colombiensis]|nr:hypothetical protein [Sphingomonas sp.]WEK44736.1 MAG: hypothetical protein P0Y64_08125 [Sphingomonas sp.]